MSQLKRCEITKGAKAREDSEGNDLKQLDIVNCDQCLLVDIKKLNTQNLSQVNIGTSVSSLPFRTDGAL
jgi:hypothetical protein